MFTLEESALLGRMLRSLAVMGLCAVAGAGYLAFRPRPEPAPTTAHHHHRLRPHQTRPHDQAKLNAKSFIFRHIHG